jgi:hypothetical protein
MAGTRIMGRPHTERAPALAVPLLFWVAGGFYGAFGAAVLASSAANLLNATFTTPTVLMAVHAFTLGFLTMTMMGALYQFGPVVLGLSPVAFGRAAAQFAVYAGGVALFLVGLGTAHLALLGVGAAAVAAGLGWFVVLLAPGLVRVAPSLVPARFVAAGLGYLLLVVTMGLLLASSWWRPWLPFRPALVTHILFGAAGWFAFVSYGVTYRLYPMFLAAPVAPRRSSVVWWLEQAGILLGVAAAWSGQSTLAVGAGAAFAGAVARYLADLRAVVRERRNRRPGAAVWLAVAAPAWIVVAAGLGAGAAGGWTRGFMLAAVALAYGWWAGIVVGFLQKIAPFATWVSWSRHGRDHSAPHVPRLWPPWWERTLSAGAAAAPMAVVVTGMLGQKLGLTVGLAAEAVVLLGLASGVLYRGVQAGRARRAG